MTSQAWSAHSSKPRSVRATQDTPASGSCQANVPLPPKWPAVRGLLAIAGYQTRDKLAEMLGNQGKDRSGAPGGPGRLSPPAATARGRR